jgi:hypothetical protein
VKEQVLRILKMVQEGRVSPEDAYDLMDAFVSFEASAEFTAPPPPPNGSKEGADEEPFRKFVDSMEKMTKDAFGSVDWGKVAEQVRAATKKGVVAVRESVDQMSKGGFRFVWFGPCDTKDVHLPIAIKPGMTLKLEQRSGDIKVLGGYESGLFKAVAKIRGKDKDDAHERASAWTPILEESEGAIVWRQGEDADEVDLEVQVPTGVNVDIRVESGDVKTKDTHGTLRLEAKAGDVDAQGLEGTVEISSFAGDVSVRNASGPSIQVENKSGDVSLSKVSGALTVRSASGDVSCREISGSAVSIETVSGDVDLDLAEPVTGALNVRTVSGDVLIDLPDGSDCQVSLSSLNGSVGSRIELSDEKRTEERITGRIGAGAGSLDASAVSGDVRLSWREHQ